ncbi:MAG: cupredoxin domain-containing protein [Chloroflexia bacterium]|nr:cupredoxin domain-containing protein [Chloroflexia bacterium]
MNRRKFLTLAGANVAGLALVGCGSGDDETARIEVTRIADVEGAPPTLAPNATPPSTQGGGQAEGGGEQPAGAGEPIQLEAVDIGWSTKELQAAPGQAIAITNAGVLPHDFTVDEWGLNEVLPNGETVEVAVPPDAQVGQSFVFYCSVQGHRQAGMEGTLSIIDAAQAGGGASPQASPEGSPQASPVAEGETDAGAPLQLEAQDPFVWSPTELSVAPGQTISVTNAGALQHSFAVDEWGVDEDLPGGQPVEVQVPSDAQAGQSWEFYCSVPGHREGGMVGTITVA